MGRRDEEGGPFGAGRFADIYHPVKGRCFLGNFSVAGIPEPCPPVPGRVRCFCSGRAQWCSESGSRAQSLRMLSDRLSLFPRAQQCSGTTSCGVGKVTTERDTLLAQCLWAVSGVSDLRSNAGLGGLSLGFSGRP